MKYVNPVEFNKLLNKFKLLKEDVGGNKSSGLTLPVDEVEAVEAQPSAEIEIAYTDYGRFYYMKVTTPSGKMQRISSISQADQALSQILKTQVQLPPSLSQVGTEEKLNGIVDQLNAKKGMKASWHDAIDVS